MKAAGVAQWVIQKIKQAGIQDQRRGSCRGGQNGMKGGLAWIGHLSLSQEKKRHEGCMKLLADCKERGSVWFVG